VVGAARSGVNETAGDTGDEEAVIDLHLDGIVEGAFPRFLEHGVEALSLGDGTGETVKDEADRMVSRHGTELDGLGLKKSAYPFLHSLLFSSSFLIMPTMISSLTRPPASMIFLASRPKGVFLATWDRSMSPVACDTCPS